MSFLARRARAQWPLLAALLAVVTVGVTLLGVCALLVTRTGERAVETAAARATPENTDITAYTVTVSGPDARSVIEDTGGVLTDAVAPFEVTLSTRTSTLLRPLPSMPHSGDFPSQGYLSSVTDLASRVEIVEGRLPAGGFETALLRSTAGQLGLTIGDRVPFGAENTRGRPAGFEVTVVGIVETLPGAGWNRDPLEGAGFNPAYNDGRFQRPLATHGPFLVDLADVLASGSTLDRLEVTARPDLSAADHAALDAVEGRVRAADRRLGGVLGDRVEVERITTALPRTLAAADAQQQVTTATVAAVAIIGSVLTATALALAARLTAGVRTVEAALLSALGFSRRQLAGIAAVEALLLTATATAIGVPASSGLHAAITRLPALRGAGLTETFAVTGLQTLTVAAGALLLGAVLVTLALQPVAEVKERRSRGELIARSGADVLLVAFAGAGLWQLWSQPAEAGGQDAVRILAPALLLLAGAALALRLVPPALALADLLARRARGFVIPLAAFEAARRPQAVAAGLLVGLACAAGTFGLGYDATWHRSQQDQAALSVGTDLALTLAARPETGQGEAVRTATGGTVSPVSDRPVSIGQWLGTGGDAPRLLAIDTTHAGDLLRGRLGDGRTWAEAGAGLAPADELAGLPVPAGAAVTVRGTSTASIPLLVAPKLVFQDRAGLRVPCVADQIMLDGTAHPLTGCVVPDGVELVAVTMPLIADWESLYASVVAQPEESDVSVTLTVPGLTGAPARAWDVGSVGPLPELVRATALDMTGETITIRSRVQLVGPLEAARTVVAAGFPAPGSVPVVISQRLADELGLSAGANLSVLVGLTPVNVLVQGVVPSVPSAPGAGALLADADWLSRAMIFSAGEVQPSVDAWWAGNLAPDAEANATALHLGAVLTRTDEEARLTGGPLRAGLPATLRLLVPAAALLLLAGVILHVTCDLQVRALEVARLRGLGMTRREIRRVLLGQHAGVLTPLVVAGALVGALATVLVVPWLVRSDTGAAPVPDVTPQWPWAAEAGLIAALLTACLVSVAVVVAVQARRADAAHLRVAS
ncbi:FtsX-like permease family protein [Catenuloplanes japonicus]|uniref:FtsX-like permease family protein n=1 Tax=Catenuloplanes japonicus TaxID=33876 RepID=UPI000A642E8F|nr:ABC transporter permease [Catenuloplanes japonicus]